jgi:hypothetical protein
MSGKIRQKGFNRIRRPPTEGPMGGSTGQREAKLGAKALAIKSARWTVGRELTTGLGYEPSITRHQGKPRLDREGGDEVVSILSSMPLAYSLDHIPCPCPSGKNPRTPLVPHQLDGKLLSSFGFTFNLLSHFLRLFL